MNKILSISAVLLFIGCSDPGNKYFTGTIDYAYSYSSDSLNADSLQEQGLPKVLSDMTR